MLKVESDPALIRKSARSLYHFLGNFNNFGRIMPAQVTNWKSTESDCSFTIQGMADIELHIVEKQEFSQIRIGAGGKTPIPLEMIWTFQPESDNSTTAKLVLEAGINPVMAMMAKAPLQNFVNMIVQKLNEITADLPD